MIPDNSLHTLQLFFPDPWHKKRHHKRRIVQLEFAEMVRQSSLSAAVYSTWQPTGKTTQNTLLK